MGADGGKGADACPTSVLSACRSRRRYCEPLGLVAGSTTSLKTPRESLSMAGMCGVGWGMSQVVAGGGGA